MSTHIQKVNPQVVPSAKFDQVVDKQKQKAKSDMIEEKLNLAKELAGKSEKGDLTKIGVTNEELPKDVKMQKSLDANRARSGKGDLTKIGLTNEGSIFRQK